MILVTVGTQLPFDRLIRAIDEIAPQLTSPVFAQIGKGGSPPRHCQFASDVTPASFDRLLEEASLIVAHAGIGSILMAQKFSKPLLIMPRRAELGEHRNDHQLATAHAMERRTGVYVAYDELALQQQLLRGSAIPPPSPDLHQRELLKRTLRHYFLYGTLNATTTTTS